MLLYQNTFGVTHMLSFLKFTISLRRWAKRIDHPHAEAVEIARISGGDRQVVDARRGGDHAVFKQIVGLPMHEPRPFSKARAVHRQDPKRSSQSVNPCLDFTSFVRVLFARPFNTSLQLAESRGCEKDLACIQTPDPCHNGTVRFWLTQFGDHVRIEKILAHWNSTGTRRRNLRRVWFVVYGLRRPLSCGEDTCSLDLPRTPPAKPAARWNQVLESRVGREQQRLNIGRCGAIQQPPFFDRHQHSRFDTPPRNDLRTLLH